MAAVLARRGDSSLVHIFAKWMAASREIPDRLTVMVNLRAAGEPHHG